MRCRKIIGWIVAICYAIVGCRRKGIARYLEYGNILSIAGHESRPDILEPIVKYLKKNGFSFISTDDLLDLSAGVKAWHPKLVWLTYDDGWAGINLLVPIMERYNIPITVFVSPEETDRRQAWPKHIQRVKDKIGSVSMFDIAARERYAIIDKCNEGESKKYDLADWAELQCFAKCRLATIENHTNTHLSCSHRPIEEVIWDVVLAKKRLHALKLSKGRLLCYPFGHVTDAVEENILALGIMPIRSDAGVMNISAPGRFRNQFHQHVTLQENIGRILGAWPASRLQHR